jgi:LacI family transcriptional regulator
VLDPISGFEGGVTLTGELLASEAKFTAMIAFDDLTALGAVRALAQAGLRVPEDCSVIGFDDVPPALLSTPGITTIRQPMEDMGSLAADFILDAIRRSDEESTEWPILNMLAPSLVLRDSTQPAKN